ncbi:MAG TPA: hypothetical protein VGO93_01775 [Candidatus Xenobia bacterium]|jgi:hypothetical protein
MGELLLPDQLQLLLESPQDGSIPFDTSSWFSDTVRSAVAWELDLP